MSLIDILIQTEFADLANSSGALAFDNVAAQGSGSVARSPAMAVTAGFVTGAGSMLAVAAIVASIAAGLFASGLGIVCYARYSARHMTRRAALERRANRRLVKAWDNDRAADAREAQMVRDAHFWEDAALWEHHEPSARSGNGRVRKGFAPGAPHTMTHAPSANSAKADNVVPLPR